jgi:two-component system, OmpR family, alkaline phosphatase synthesis response regulator PhoP
MTNKSNAVTVRGLVIDLETATAFVEGHPVWLTRTEFRLLYFLASHAGKAFGRQQLIEAVHGPHYPASDRSVDSQIVELRKKLGDRAGWIEAVRGVGYRFRRDGNY